MASKIAAERGRRTLLLEKNARPGLKILISGGGRCNLTTTKAGRDLEQQYGTRRGRFLRHALRQFQPTALCAMFEAAGVRLREEDLDKIFPVSQRASAVLDALVAMTRAAGADLRLSTPVQDVAVRPEGGFEIAIEGAVIRASAVVLATGGLSYPKTGATGDGYPWLRAVGHTVTATFPALAPLVVPVEWVRALQGIVLDGVDLSSIVDGRAVTTRRRPVLFTHHGLSGPAPMDLAGDIEEAGGGAVRFDLMPGSGSTDELERDWLAQCRAHGGRRVESLLGTALPERVRGSLVALAGIARDCTLANLGKTERRRLLGSLRDLRVEVPKSRGYAHAEVTRGGLALDEVDPRTCESRRVPGMFVCGELLDVDGPIGGFNFQAAFATGRLAGLHA